MSHSNSARELMLAVGFVFATASASGAQASVAPPPPPASAAAPVIIQPPAPVIPPRRGVRIASTAPAVLPAPMAPPRGSPHPDSLLPRRAQRIALVTPTPLTRPTPTRRIRDFGRVRTDVARQAPPAGATGRCKDGTFLTVAPSEEACLGRGGLAMRAPRVRTAPVAPVRRQ